MFPQHRPAEGGCIGPIGEGRISGIEWKNGRSLYEASSAVTEPRLGRPDRLAGRLQPRAAPQRPRRWPRRRVPPDANVIWAGGMPQPCLASPPASGTKTTRDSTMVLRISSRHDRRGHLRVPPGSQPLADAPAGIGAVKWWITRSWDDAVAMCQGADKMVDQAIAFRVADLGLSSLARYLEDGQVQDEGGEVECPAQPKHHFGKDAIIGLVIALVVMVDNH